MNTYDFTFILSGVDPALPQEVLDAFAEHCPDATLSSSEGVVYLDFNKMGERHIQTIRDAARCVEHADVGATVAKVIMPN